MPKTINNIAKKHAAIMDLAHGIDRNWTTAQKTLHKLNELGVSHVALVMEKYGNLLVYKNKGRPTAAEAQYIEMTGDLRKELKN